MYVMKPCEGDTFHKTGYIDLACLQEVTDVNSEFYFCGPTPFMKAIYKALKEWKVAEDRIHYEFFGPAGSLEA